MAQPRYNGRTCMVYLPSEEFLAKWSTQAEQAGLSLSKWICEVVEAYEGQNIDPALIRDQNKLRDEVRELKRSLEEKDATIKRLEGELFKLRHAGPAFGGHIDEKIIVALKRGGLWPGQELLKELGIDPHDVEAIQIITEQLQVLQDFGLAKETARGWAWLK
jgi:hypothetical protein